MGILPVVKNGYSTYALRNCKIAIGWVHGFIGPTVRWKRPKHHESPDHNKLDNLCLTG